MEAICAENLTFAYPAMTGGRGRDVIENLSFKIEKGECVGLAGCNGVGKSTLLKLMAGIEYQYRGKLLMGGLEVTKQNLREIRQSTGYIFQDSEHQLFMSTVYDDVAFGPENYGLTKDEVKLRTEDALRKVYMEELAGERIYRLSGGQKKLASIASVLSMNPSVLLMDEPSAALDPKNRRNLIEVLNELEITKVIASHDLDFLYDTCDRVILMGEGRLAADGGAKELLKKQDLLEECGLELPLSFSRIKTL